ncbi:MAG: cellulase family glycosylhydrolase [Halococcoides sp.]
MDRRTFLKATGATGAMAVGLGAGVAGNAMGGLTEFPKLTVSSDNRIVRDDTGDTVRLRGLNIPDPKRMDYTQKVRGKNTRQLIDLITNNEAGWYPRAIRIPAQPGDIGEHRIGANGPVYEASELTNPDAVAHDDQGNIARQKQVPPPVPAFDRSQLRDYIQNYYKPAVQRCKERGVYCIIEYHRHWHEQPPGTKDPSGAENHLPYNNDYTLYWAYNDHPEFGKDAPASWGWVDQKTINQLTSADGWTGWTGWSDAPSDPAENPYLYENWKINQPLQDEVIMFWEEMLAEFGDEPHVLFEPYNELTAPGLWGPAKGTGCGAWKQRDLWKTYQEDFMAPILDTIRNHEKTDNRVLMVGVPGWDQGIQGLYWNDFNDLGYENIAVTWHNYAGHDVSQLHNWFNDTSYQCWRDIEDTKQSAGDKEADLEDPYLNPPGWSDACGKSTDKPESNCSCGSQSSSACWGWEGYEAAGLQETYQFHPIAVTEFGWMDDPSVSHWLRGSTTGQGSTGAYGKPFIKAVEGDERISWIHWCADVRWLPTMFKVDWTVEEGGVNLTDHNWYKTDIGALDDKYKCNDMPCDWAVTQNPNSGQFVKDKLAELAGDTVPIETEAVGSGTTTTTTDGTGDTTTTTTDGTGGGPSWPTDATDPNGDGLYEDLSGNGQIDFPDVNELFQNSDTSKVQENTQYYDFEDSGSINLQDVMALFHMV